MKKLLFTLLILILLVGVGWAYWYFLMGPAQVQQPTTQPGSQQGGFQPINRPISTPRPGSGQGGGTNGGTGGTNGGANGGQNQPSMRFAALRLLADSPVGGYGASTTASTTSVFWVDRGRGNVYRANLASTSVDTLSNTVVPKIFMAVWNRNMTAFVGSVLSDQSLTPTTVYAELSKLSSTSKDRLAPYELRGKNLPAKVITYATSPDRAKLVYVVDENGSGVGYVASFNGQGATRLFTTPLTQVQIAWPADNTIAVTTNSSNQYSSYLYFVNAKSGLMSKVLGPVVGLGATVSADAKHVLYSYSSNGAIYTKIFNVSSGTSTDAVIRTLAEKCAWGNLNRTLAYCAVPSDPISENYPDDWYIGSASTNDKIWQINATTGDVKLISSVINEADRAIDGYRMSLDAKDKFLFFMNKNDLTLWSLDLSKTR